ncbi:hypothetical protein [Roseibium sp.]|uniref:hypothetical protein n=1 Tax=Roseibium sp. TaxID=1936156 RepID=UPI003B52BF80
MLRLLIAVLTALSLSACATAERRAIEAGARLGQAAAQENPDPALPGDCRRRERSGVQEGEPLDVALIKTDQALGRANARVQRCAKWHDTFRQKMKAGL